MLFNIALPIRGLRRTDLTSGQLMTNIAQTCIDLDQGWLAKMSLLVRYGNWVWIMIRPTIQSNGSTQMTNSEILDILDENLKLQSQLCFKLEELADNLPNDVDVQRCILLARTILPVLTQAHNFEETIIFPILRKRHDEDHPIVVTLNRLKFEHWEDESFGEELRECMLKFAAGQGEDCVSVLSYMLRGFFEGLRRHLAFERDHIVPLLR